jgi:hypothetical protein
MRWTILVVSHDTATTRAVEVGRGTLLLAGAGAVLAAAAVALGIAAAAPVPVALARDVLLEHAHRALVTRFAHVSARAAALADSLDVLARQEPVVRLVAGLDPPPRDLVDTSAEEPAPLAPLADDPMSRPPGRAVAAHADSAAAAAGDSAAAPAGAAASNPVREDTATADSIPHSRR